MPGFISASKIQKRLGKHFYCLNGLVVGAVFCQLFTKKRIERPNSRPICLFGRGPVLVGHLVLWGRVQEQLAMSLTAASVSRDSNAERNTEGTLVHANVQSLKSGDVVIRHFSVLTS